MASRLPSFAAHTSSAVLPGRGGNSWYATGMSCAAPRLLAIDLDGTFLSRAGHPHQVDVRALRAARDAGITVAIVTGRLFSGTRQAARLLGLEGPVGCADGSHIVHAASGATLEHTTIRGDDALKLRAGLELGELATFVFAQDTIVHDERGDDYLDYLRTWSPQTERAQRVLEHASWSQDGVTAVVSLADEASIGAATASIRSELAHAAQVVAFPLGKTGVWALLARSCGIDKGTALKFIAQNAGVALAETVAVGDWINDVPMFRAAGRSFAMRQAPDEVKAAATDVLSETAEVGGGIACVVREIFGVRF